jgi:hypothetical protein
LEEDNEEDTKIKEEKVNNSLSDNKALLELALASTIDTIKCQPDMYPNLLMISSKLTGAPFEPIILLQLSMDNFMCFRIAILKLTIYDIR